MANIRFGWKNLCLESGVTFTPSSEAAAHDADNLGKRHPSRFWRITTLTGDPNVAISLVEPVPFIELVQPLYSIATPTRNLVRHSSDFTETGDWIDLNISVRAAGGTLVPISGAKFTSIGEGTATGEHYVQQAISKPTGLAGGEVSPFIAKGYFRDTEGTGGNTRHVRLRVGSDGTNHLFVDVNLSTGVVNGAATAAGTFSLTSATVSVGGTVSGIDWYKVVLIGTVDHTGSTNMNFRVQMLDGSFSTSYTGTSDSLEACALDLRWGSDDSVEADDVEALGDRGAYWFYRLRASAAGPTRYTSPFFPLMGSAHGRFSRATGWAHGAGGVVPSDEVQVQGAVQCYFYDPDNAAAQLDISNIYIGPAWSPTKNLSEDFSWGVDPITRGRVLSLTIPYADEDEFKADAMPMALTAGVGIKSAATADGGQEYRRDRRPILVLLDPDATTYAQEDMIYGWIDEFRVRANKYIADVDGNGTSGLAYAVEMTIKEVLP